MKSFSDFVGQLRREGRMLELKKPCSLKLELASVMKELDGRVVYTNRIPELPGAEAVGNVFSTKDLVAEYLGAKKEELVVRLIHTINNPTKPELTSAGNAPVLEVTEPMVDLSKIPIPFHAPKDGGPYFSSAVVISNDREYGRNCSFHRLMVIGKDTVVARILKRHLDEYLLRADGKGLDVAIVVGAPINVLLAAATSVEIGKDELSIANSLASLQTVKLGNGIEMPADCEYAFEAKITSELHDEGPFVDMTETYDIVRKQRVVKITAVHHRKNPLFHVLLPGGLEHKILMGMPREPTIWNEVSKAAECTGVNITPGGCSWLHAVIAIRKKSEEDGKKAIEAAFLGHHSLKLAIVVDEDIDIYDPMQVEWALATRFQAKSGLVVKEKEKGSSLDPSADPNTRETSKIGLDATKPLVAKGKDFTRAQMPKVR